MTVVIVLQLAGVTGHGRLMDPPARNSMWRFGFANPVNYNDNELFCGGYAGRHFSNSRYEFRVNYDLPITYSWSLKILKNKIFLGLKMCLVTKTSYGASSPLLIINHSMLSLNK